MDIKQVDIMKRQRGISLIGFILLLAVAVFVTYIGMKIVPIYVDYFSVSSAMKGIQNEPGIANKSPRDIKSLFFRRLYVNFVEVVKEENVKVTRRGGLQLQVAYEVRRPIMGNLDVIVTFDKSVYLNQR